MLKSKLYILLIFDILEVTKLLIINRPMHNLYAIFAKFLHICKRFSYNLVNEYGNLPRPGVIPRFSDLEVFVSALQWSQLGWIARAIY